MAGVAAAVCPHCRDWTSSPEDRFCGGCGAFVAPVIFEWGLQGQGTAAKLALRARPTDPGAVVDPAAFADVRLTVSNEVQDPARRGSTVDLARALAPGGVPLMEETRGLRGAAPQVLVVRALAGRAGFGDQSARGEILALTQALPPPVLALAGPSISIPDLLEAPDPTVRLANDGGAVAVHGLRLVLDDVFDPSAAWTRLPGPVVIETGEAADLPLRLSDAQIAALRTADRVFEGEIEIIDGLGAAMSAGRVSLILPLAPDAKLEVAAFGMALTGRQARLAVRLTNTGGHPLSAFDIQIEAALDGQSHVSGLPTPVCWSATLDRRDAVDVELRPWMTVGGRPDAEPLPAGLYDLTVRVKARSGGLVLEREALGGLRVRDPAPLEGRICIDFGTTESAAALALGKLERLTEGESLPPPLIIELGRVGMPSDGAGFGDRFLPTVVFRAGDGDLSFGDEALLREIDPRRGDRLMSNFKWRLEDGDGAEAATQYLAHVRRLIEEHPLVAAEITPQTEIYATRPVDFADGQAEALAKAFRDAGFREPRTSIFARQEAPTLIYESWSPMIMALFEEPWIFTPLDREVILREGFVLPGQVGQTGYVTVFDIGGGSADLSVLKADESPGLRRIVEVYKRTDLDFVGLKFADLIRRELSGWLRDRGLSPSETPADETAWAEAVRAVQHNPGLLSDGSFETPLRDFFRVCLDGGEGGPDLVRSLSGRLGVSLEGEPRLIHVSEAQASLRARMMPYLRRLRLPLAGGGHKAVTVGDLPQLLGRVASAFAARYVQRVNGLVEDLVNASGLSALRDAPEADSAQLSRLIQSGRGAAFPLADNLVSTLFGPLREKRLQAVRLPPLSAKSITSYGGLYLADHAAMDWDVSFNLGREVRRYWVGIGYSTRPGSRGPLRMPAPRLEDGVSVLNCADIPERFRDGPWRIEASWEGSTRYDDCGQLPAPPGFAGRSERFWLVARRRGNSDHITCVEAASAAEAAAQTLTEGVA